MKIPIIMHKSKSGRIYYYYGYEWRMCNMYKESENDYGSASLDMHYRKRGKIVIVPTVPTETSEDLSLAYTPGVASACLEIEKDVEKSYMLTRRWNIAVVAPTEATEVESAMFPSIATSTALNNVWISVPIISGILYNIISFRIGPWVASIVFRPNIIIPSFH